MDSRQHPDGDEASTPMWFKACLLAFFVVPLIPLLGMSAYRTTEHAQKQKDYSADIAGKCFTTSTGRSGRAEGGNLASNSVTLLLGNERVIHARDSILKVPCEQNSSELPR